MGNADWFFKVGDEVHGPVSPGELRQKAASGEVRPDTPVRKGADGPLVHAEKVQRLFQRSDSPPSAVINSLFAPR